MLLKNIPTVTVKNRDGWQLSLYPSAENSVPYFVLFSPFKKAYIASSAMTIDQTVQWQLALSNNIEETLRQYFSRFSNDKYAQPFTIADGRLFIGRYGLLGGCKFFAYTVAVVNLGMAAVSLVTPGGALAVPIFLSAGLKTLNHANSDDTSFWGTVREATIGYATGTACAITGGVSEALVLGQVATGVAVGVVGGLTDNTARAVINNEPHLVAPEELLKTALIGSVSGGIAGGAGEMMSSATQGAQRAAIISGDEITQRLLSSGVAASAGGLSAGAGQAISDICDGNGINAKKVGNAVVNGIVSGAVVGYINPVAKMSREDRQKMYHYRRSDGNHQKAVNMYDNAMEHRWNYIQDKTAAGHTFYRKGKEITPQEAFEYSVKGTRYHYKDDKGHVTKAHDSKIKKPGLAPVPPEVQPIQQPLVAAQSTLESERVRIATDAEPARADAEPAREEVEPAREEVEPAREEVEPAREEVEPARAEPEPAIIEAEAENASADAVVSHRQPALPVRDDNGFLPLHIPQRERNLAGNPAHGRALDDNGFFALPRHPQHQVVDAIDRLDSGVADEETPATTHGEHVLDYTSRPGERRIGDYMSVAHTVFYAGGDRREQIAAQRANRPRL